MDLRRKLLELMEDRVNYYQRHREMPGERSLFAALKSVCADHGLTCFNYGNGHFQVKNADGESFNWWPFSKKKTVYINYGDYKSSAKDVMGFLTSAGLIRNVSDCDRGISKDLRLSCDFKNK